MITLSDTAQETRRHGLLEFELRFCSNRTEIVNGTGVVKSPHDLLTMGLDMHLCTHPNISSVVSVPKCTHLLKEEVQLVRATVIEVYVKYGTTVFEY